ncbi:hypothetical protein BHM03_00015257 [Ensete ventricosum]|nr:hypothetical protein BHM03_00015257 [Ensete ventricosum]
MLGSTYICGVRSELGTKTCFASSLTGNQIKEVFVELGVVVEESARSSSSHVRMLIHIRREWGVKLGWDLRLGNLHLESASSDGVLHNGPIGVGVPDVTPLTFKSVFRVGLA